MTPESALQLAMGCAAVPTCWWAWRRREHRPLAALVLYACVSDPTLRALRTGVIVPAQEALRASGGDPLAAPLLGWPGVATDLYRIAWSGWPPAVALAAALVFRRRNDAKLATLTWLGAAALIVLGREHFVGPSVKPIYLASEMISLAIGVRAALAWATRRRSPELHHLAAGSCLLFQGAALFAYHAPGPFWGGTWDLARVAFIGLFSMLALLEGGALWISRSKPSSAL